MSLLADMDRAQERGCPQDPSRGMSRHLEVPPKPHRDEMPQWRSRAGGCPGPREPTGRAAQAIGAGLTPRVIAAGSVNSDGFVIINASPTGNEPWRVFLVQVLHVCFLALRDPYGRRAVTAARSLRAHGKYSIIFAMLKRVVSGIYRIISAIIFAIG
jgi:hypothetical protein